MQTLRYIILSLTLPLFFAVPASASAPLAPGLYGGQPPPGQVLPDNELTLPAGKPKGYVLLVHGGGWLMTGPQALERSYASWFVSLGWAVYDIDYRPGILSLVDVVASYDHLRALHPVAPICADGSSAGGHLVMLLAASRPSLNCTISEAGITNLTTLHNWLQVIVEKYVYSGALWEFSPVRVAKYIAQPLLCAGSTWDTTVPEVEQLAEMKAARPKTQTMPLDGAPTVGWGNFTHASVTDAALSSFQQAVRSMLSNAIKAQDARLFLRGIMGKQHKTHHR